MWSSLHTRDTYPPGSAPLKTCTNDNFQNSKTTFCEKKKKIGFRDFTQGEAVCLN